MVVIKIKVNIFCTCLQACIKKPDFKAGSSVRLDPNGWILDTSTKGTSGRFLQYQL